MIWINPTEINLFTFSNEEKKILCEQKKNDNKKEKVFNAKKDQTKPNRKTMFFGLNNVRLQLAIEHVNDHKKETLI